MTKDIFMEMRISQAMVETDQIDLLVMETPRVPVVTVIPTTCCGSTWSNLEKIMTL